MTKSQEWVVRVGRRLHPRRENVVVRGGSAKRISPGVAGCANTTVIGGRAAKESVVRVDNLVSVVFLVLLMLLEIVK